MTSIKLRYVHRFRDRHGRARFYFRHPGYKQVPLPGLPGSREFMEAYQAALAGEPLPIAAGKAAPGSMSALIASWYQTADFRNLSPATQYVYRLVVEKLRAEHGDKPVAALQPHNVRALINRKAQTPAAANRLRSILRLLMRHAVESRMRTDNPMHDVRRVRYRVKGFPTWAEEDIAAFEKRWPVGTRARRALALLLYTGQRRSDVIRMGRQHLRGNAINVRQKKTDERLTIPLHPALREVIGACPADHLTFLMTELGKPFASGNAFYNWFVDCARKAGIEKGLAPHGLRKAAARRLAEAGCTPHQIAAVTGHTTLKEIERYTKAVDQERLARAAIARIGKMPDGK